MDRIGLPVATAASAVGGFGHDAAAAGFAPGGCVGSQAGRTVQGDHHRPGVRDRVSGDMPEILFGPGARSTGRGLTAEVCCFPLEGIGRDMRPAATRWPAPFAPGSAVGRIRDAGCMDLHPRGRA